MVILQKYREQMEFENSVRLFMSDAGKRNIPHAPSPGLSSTQLSEIFLFLPEPKSLKGPENVKLTTLFPCMEETFYGSHIAQL